MNKKTRLLIEMIKKLSPEDQKLFLYKSDISNREVINLGWLEWDGDLDQSCQMVKGNLYQEEQEVQGSLFQGGQFVKGDLYE